MTPHHHENVLRRYEATAMSGSKDYTSFPTDWATGNDEYLGLMAATFYLRSIYGSGLATGTAQVMLPRDQSARDET